MKKFLEEFKAFALKGNVLDLAVAVIIGGAFQSIINSVVNDLIMPLVGFIFGGLDFTNLFIPLQKGSALISASDVSGGDIAVGKASLAQLEAAGVGVFKYGSFITAVINFILMALVIFLLVKGINKLGELGKAGLAKKKGGKKEEAPAPTTKICPFCQSEISIKATRCPHCTSELKK